MGCKNKTLQMLKEYNDHQQYQDAAFNETKESVQFECLQEMCVLNALALLSEFILTFAEPSYSNITRVATTIHIYFLEVFKKAHQLLNT
ncbi:hypothetical protein PPL_12263 [Heterostelium album PN500]|uniref:Uncharacterized protein n=1 Tax=Heterostelium pallidum (strain ATCC 26659 / Pp 5 / PN500) TaxID=670386 RepID=D3BM54_HETP5|nr:hypothetical protein PPL_12263 [Heterostelium album PN500]EFA77655.1 hypothetical protein PPL_12263 [Heterostelium album PN500]|eukprot:XP_020429783.1 hypothetical protein PPL_12263 [Heterostelium album PN500]